MHQHQADRQRDHQQIELAHPAQSGRLAAAFRQVHAADRKTLASALVALSASLGQIARIDARARIGGGQNVVEAVATRAVGHRLVALLGCQAVKGRVKADDPIGWQAELA